MQDFIATARRCRDLWFGSWLLSELSKATALAIAQGERKEALIFPPPGTDLSPGSPDSVANKVVAVVKGNVLHLVDVAHQAAKDRLDAIANEVWKQFGDSLGPQDLRFAKAQINELLEWNWATAEFQLGQGDECEADPAFIEAKTRAERLLAARKSCRDFGCVGDWGSSRPKSSLDGARESVISKMAYNQDAVQLYEQWGVRPGEQLCGVGLVKRHGERGAQDSRIFSTSHIAAQGLLERWNRDFERDETSARNRVADFVRDLHRLGLESKALGAVPRDYEDGIFGEFDGHLLFTNRLSEFFVAPRVGDSERDRQERENAKAKSEDAVRHLDTLLKGLKTNDSPKDPCPYYGVLLADGDFMGAAISAADNPARNQFLSSQLAGFAAEAKRIVDNHCGSLIYAGGDDVLALLPLHNAIQAARELAITFRQTFEDSRFDAWIKQRPSLSAGLAIVHHLEPLSEALDSARRAEKAAKSVTDDRGKKNALAVLLDKRSGGQQLIAAHWSLPNQPFSGLDGRLEAFARWFRAGVVSRSLMSDWAELSRRYEPLPGQMWDDGQWDAIAEQWELEAYWLARRKRETGGQNRISDPVLDNLQQLLQSARKANPRGPWLAGLVAEMSVAKEIFLAQRIAGFAVEIEPDLANEADIGDTLAGELQAEIQGGIA